MFIIAQRISDQWISPRAELIENAAISILTDDHATLLVAAQGWVLADGF